MIKNIIIIILVMCFVGCYEPEVIEITGGVLSENLVEGIYKGKYIIIENNYAGNRYEVGTIVKLILNKSGILFIEK
uniref:Uncharacterized protein n=2 Tax=viral metagenome TaxID=1070528 RepID=A0A6M3MA22_9ZZZZ